MSDTSGKTNGQSQTITFTLDGQSLGNFHWSITDSSNHLLTALFPRDRNKVSA